MIVSPRPRRPPATSSAPTRSARDPFKFVERVAQDRIVVERFPNYWNKGEIHFDRIVYVPIPDATVRLSNLRAGQLDFIERVLPSDVPAAQDRRALQARQITELGYQGITINVGKSDARAEESARRDPRVREAFELSLDRDGIVQVAMDGEATVGNQWVRADQCVLREEHAGAEARRRAREGAAAGSRRAQPAFTLMTPTNTDAQKTAQVVQAMAKEAGFDVKIQSTEFSTSLDLADKGQFDAYVLAWSGRADPDGNIYSFDACKQPLNNAGYCKPEVDELLTKSRTTRDPAERQKLYEQLAAIALKDRPIIYLYHRNWLWAYTNKLAACARCPTAWCACRD